MKNIFVLLLVALAMAVFAATPLPAFTDDFNRADSLSLGSNWTQYGDMGILDNQASSSTRASNYATVNGFSGNYLSTIVSVDAININVGTDVHYVALLFGVASSSESIFVKVQDQGGNGQFNTAFFYYGNNGVDGTYFLLDSPFQQGRIFAWASDIDTMSLGIDTNFDNVLEQTYSTTGWASKTFGDGVGLGLFNNSVRADNFSTERTPVPEPSTFLLLGGGLAGLAFVVRKRKK